MNVFDPPIAQQTTEVWFWAHGERAVGVAHAAGDIDDLARLVEERDAWVGVLVARPRVLVVAGRPSASRGPSVASVCGAPGTLSATS